MILTWLGPQGSMLGPINPDFLQEAAFWLIAETQIGFVTSDRAPVLYMQGGHALINLQQFQNLMDVTALKIVVPEAK